MTPFIRGVRWLSKVPYRSENGEVNDFARLKWSHSPQGNLIRLIRSGAWRPPDCDFPVRILLHEGQRDVHPMLRPMGSELLPVPCRKCKRCLARRRRQWFARIVREMEVAPRSWFVTFTYRGDRGVGDYAPVQRWLKRLRKRIGPFRYVAVLEAGDQGGRLHWHLMLHCSRAVKVRDVRVDNRTGFLGVKLASPDRASYLAHYAGAAMLKVHASLRYGGGG